MGASSLSVGSNSDVAQDQRLEARELLLKQETRSTPQKRGRRRSGDGIEIEIPQKCAGERLEWRKARVGLEAVSRREK